MHKIGTYVTMSSKFSFYVDMISILALSTMTAASDDGVYLLATALYGTDTQGRHLLVSGPIPSIVADIIKTDMQARIHPKAIIKVVPIIQNTSLPLGDDDLINLLQQFKSYPILKADLSKEESRKSLKNLWYYITEERKKHRREKEKAEKGSQEETTTEQIQKKITIPSKSDLDPDDYVPNDIYYAIEKKCANWADGCDIKSPSILEMSSTHFKVPIGYRKPPLKLNWTP